MVRYLSTAWFERLRDHTGSTGAPRPGAADGLVLRYRVGEATEIVSYDVVVAGGAASVRHPVDGDADVTFTSDYPTAAAVASGRLSSQAALVEGRIRVSGDVTLLTRRSAEVAGMDPIPPGLRAETEY